MNLALSLWTSALAASIFSLDILRSLYFLALTEGLTLSLWTMMPCLTLTRSKEDHVNTSLFLSENWAAGLLPPCARSWLIIIVLFGTAGSIGTLFPSYVVWIWFFVMFWCLRRVGNKFLALLGEAVDIAFGQMWGPSLFCEQLAGLRILWLPQSGQRSSCIDKCHVWPLQNCWLCPTLGWRCTGKPCTLYWMLSALCLHWGQPQTKVVVLFSNRHVPFYQNHKGDF